MPEINLVDRTLQHYSNKTEISIQISLSGFSFCIYSPENNLIRAFHYYKFTNTLLQEDFLNSVDDILHKDDLLRLPQKKARVVITGRKSTMIPHEFFHVEQLKQMLEFNHPIEDLEEIHYNNINFCDSYLTFAVPSYLAGMVAEKFKHIEFYNQASPLLFYAHQLIKEGKGDGVLVNLNKEFFDIIVIQNNSLKLINTFLYVNSTDLLYFILYVCKQLKIDPNAISFYLTGEESNNRSLISDLSEYISRLEKTFVLPGIELAYSLKMIDASRHFTLLHLALCE